MVMVFMKNWREKALDNDQIRGERVLSYIQELYAIKRMAREPCPKL